MRYICSSPFQTSGSKWLTSNAQQVNRNKKSIGLSFAHKSGVEILHKLVKESDVLVENYLPGGLKKYGMDYETLRSINPRLIYASITGYGQTGPYSNRAGYDVMVEAEMGLMHITGARDGDPVKVGVAVTDLTTGLYTSNAIMAALLARSRTGTGQHIDASLSDCQVATLSNLASSALISGKKDSGRWGTAHRKYNWIVIFAKGCRIANRLNKLLSCPTGATRPSMVTFCSEAGMTSCLAYCLTGWDTLSGRRMLALRQTAIE